jgi:hypothetical protein
MAHEFCQGWSGDKQGQSAAGPGKLSTYVDYDIPPPNKENTLLVGEQRPPASLYRKLE